jgi:hypothetical protein
VEIIKAFLYEFEQIIVHMYGKLLPVLFLALVVFTSGCLSVSPEALALANPMVKDFLDEHPNAAIQATFFTTEQMETMLAAIKDECDNEFLLAGEGYRVTVTDASTGFYAKAWIMDSKVVCAIKMGSSGKEVGEPEPVEPVKPAEPKECEDEYEKACHEGHVWWYDSCGKPYKKAQYCDYGCAEAECKSEPGCTSQHEYTCFEGNIWWYDSCGELEKIKYECDLGCHPGTNKCLTGTNCTSHHEYKCYGGHVYWYDSCGKFEEKKEACEHGCLEAACKPGSNCTAHYEKKCKNGDVWWYDSCGEPEEKLEECLYGCLEAACKPYGGGDCEDSDWGKTYFLKGTATAGSSSLTDHCNADGTLTEKYCEGNEIKAVKYVCPTFSVCDDGACVWGLGSTETFFMDAGHGRTVIVDGILPYSW